MNQALPESVLRERIKAACVKPKSIRMIIQSTGSSRVFVLRVCGKMVADNELVSGIGYNNVATFQTKEKEC